jgi:hypothetical protein
MTDHRNRYPGAQPFSDDDVSRKVFFGRENAARVLTDKILANHVVTVYARSGLGKTSLLKAGVAERLREEGYLPLFVRVNDADSGPFRALLETIPGEAARQDIEYVEGRSESLWSFFKTAQFWRGDLLLTPVLMLDQFEELFTLQSEDARGRLLDELSYLIRGVGPPPGEETPLGEKLSEQPPGVRIVLSLREDYLAFLEDAAEHIPQILDARFRLAPLELDAAEEAIVGPAAVTDSSLETRPFTLDGAAVTEILDYLSRSHKPRIGESRRYVEPFQLQLICGRVEQIVEARQRLSGADLPITMADLGGKPGLTETLRDHYREAIESVPTRRGRRASRRLCEDYLISPEGRRLSLEENELRRRLHLPRETLDTLVAARLLRSENRSESTYYELSHDALVDPILASRPTKAQLMNMLGIGVGVLLFPSSLVVLLILAGYNVSNPVPGGERAGDLVVAVAMLPVIVSSAFLLRGSARSMLRYQLARQAIAGPDVPIRSGFVAGLSTLAVGVVIALAGLGYLVLTARSFLQPHEYDRFVDRPKGHWIGLDTLVYSVAAAAMLMVAWRVCRRGFYRLAGVRGRRLLPAIYGPGGHSRLYATLRLLLGGIMLLAAIMLVGIDVVLVQCSSARGHLPPWLPAEWFKILPVTCNENGYSQVFTDILALAALLAVGIPMLRRGIAGIRHTSPQRSGAPTVVRADLAEHA